MAYLGDNAIEMEPIETENIGSLGSLILSELPGCDDLIVRQQLGYALREFCRETNACVVEAPVCADAGNDHWGVWFPMPHSPSDMVVGTILEVRTKAGRSLAFTVCNAPRPLIKTNDYICDGEMAVVRFSVYPKAGGEKCPRWFKERFAEAITAGAMHHLLSMQGRVWANPARAAEYGAKYADAIAEASYRSLGSQMQSGAESAIPCGGLFM